MRCLIWTLEAGDLLRLDVAEIEVVTDLASTDGFPVVFDLLTQSTDTSIRMGDVGVSVTPYSVIMEYLGSHRSWERRLDPLLLVCGFSDRTCHASVVRIGAH